MYNILFHMSKSLSDPFPPSITPSLITTQVKTILLPQSKAVQSSPIIVLLLVKKTITARTDYNSSH